jgi:V/A-type H+-transporting ATPase subunit I
MFTPVPMSRVTLYLLDEDGPTAAVALAESGAFDPVTAPAGEEALPEAAGREYRELYNEARRRLDRLAGTLRLDLPPAPEAPEPVDRAELAGWRDWLGEVWQACSACQEEERHIEEEERQLNQLERFFHQYRDLDLDLELVHGGMRFLDLRLGTVPVREVRRLRFSVGLVGYVLTELTRGEDNATVALAGVGGAEEDLRGVLQAASFRELEVPPELRGHPDQVRGELDRRWAVLEQRRRALEADLADHRAEHGETIRRGATRLAAAAPYVALSEGLERQGRLCRVAGWVPADELDGLKARLAERLAGRYSLEEREPTREERPRVPTLTRYPGWLRPFVALVRNYGVPRYGELDPTWLFAVTFVLMFGMMFGDVGHGLLIAAGGLAFRRRLSGFAPFAVASGLSSAAFGVVYGSVFGYETLIHPLWASPLADPARMLELALYWGVGFILVATGLTVRNRLAERRWAEALLDGTGLAGLGLYAGLLYAAYAVAGGGAFGWTEAGGILGPLALVLGYRWREAPGGTGERLLVTAMEGFETLMGYITNTLSFLRVAAFSLNHVALAVAVFTLAGMMGPAGHWITVVLGNVFILVLEGAIVAIQVLRLEYYEGFARFFRGDGRPFRPLKLEPA